MPKLLDAPFWLDPSDRHRMAGVMQVASRPTYNHAHTSGNWRLDRVWQEHTRSVGQVSRGPEPDSVEHEIAGSPAPTGGLTPSHP
jgi:hypothetical protein